MTPHLAETLQDLKLKQELDSMVAGRPIPKWVFANKKGEIFVRVALENALNRCLEKAKLRRIRIHDLRHTYATIRLMRGHNVGDVSYVR
jgi:integrase